MTEIAPLDLADKAERVSLALSSPLTAVDCPVFHRFGPGVYLREVHLPAGTLAVGHRHRAEHLNIMLAGVIDIVIGDAQMQRLTAPAILTAPPGRKVALVVEDTVWVNVYATEETDVEKLEAMILDKSPAWEAAAAVEFANHHRLRQPDRDDFAAAMTELGIAAVIVPDAPPPGGKLTVRRSPIDGQGLFLSASAAAGEVLGLASALRWANHAANPNAEILDGALVARRAIAGCVGGGQGEEVTVDYRRALAGVVGGAS